MMRIRRHTKSGLWVREDGAVCMPPSPKYPRYRWTFGSPTHYGYFSVMCGGKNYMVHRLVASAFLSNPDNLPTVDHINRIKTDNHVSNLRFATYKMQNDNRKRVDDALERLGVRCCEDKRAYDAAYTAFRYRMDPAFRARKLQTNRESYRRLHNS